mgnify:CR=1 FL=1
MKKSILLFAMAFVALAVNAQKVKEADVPPAIKAAFTKMHPNAKVDKWEKEGTNYEAEFTENKVETSVELGPNGQLIATEIEINVSELPKAIAEYCAKNMPGKKIAEASKITTASGTVSYEAEVDEADYIFDSNGTFVKKEIEKDDDKDDDEKK